MVGVRSFFFLAKFSLLRAEGRGPVKVTVAPQLIAVAEALGGDKDGALHPTHTLSQTISQRESLTGRAH